MTKTSEKTEDQPRAGYSPEFLTHALTPQNVGLMSNPDGYGAPQGECGDMMEIGLRVRDGRIDNINFITDGCAFTVACGSVVTTLAKGRTVAEVLEIKAVDIISVLGGLPPEHEHCARLAVDTLRLAVKDYLKNRAAPWKKLYQPAGRPR